MNIQNLFVRAPDQQTVVRLVTDYVNGKDRPSQPDWGLPNSYDSFLANGKKRRLAVSPPQGGWIAVIESKEVVDFAMAKVIADTLGTTVVVVHYYDVVSAWGHAVYRDLKVTDSYFDEDARSPLAEARRVLKNHDIPLDLMMFREAAERLRSGWVLVSPAPKGKS